MAKKKPHPTPWILDSPFDMIFDYGVRDARGYWVLGLYARDAVPEEIANLKRIVRAVNAQEKKS